MKVGNVPEFAPCLRNTISQHLPPYQGPKRYGNPDGRRRVVLWNIACWTCNKNKTTHIDRGGLARCSYCKAIVRRASQGRTVALPRSSAMRSLERVLAGCQSPTIALLDCICARTHPQLIERIHRSQELRPEVVHKSGRRQLRLAASETGSRLLGMRPQDSTRPYKITRHEQRIFLVGTVYTRLIMRP